MEFGSDGPWFMPGHQGPSISRSRQSSSRCWPRGLCMSPSALEAFLVLIYANSAARARFKAWSLWRSEVCWIVRQWMCCAPHRGM